MTADSTLATVRVERVMAAPPGEVYDAWVDAVSLADFIAPAPGTAEVENDPRVGGGLRIVMTFPDRTTVIEGEYLALDRPDRISFTWRVAASDIDSVVTVTFAVRGSRETLMTITHSRLPAVWVDSYRYGWGLIRDQLAGWWA